MNLEVFACKCGLPSEFIKTILTVPETGCNISALETLFHQDLHTFFNAVPQAAAACQLDVRVLYGYLFTLLAVNAYDEYQKRGISDTIYFDTMHDLAIWAENCHTATGIWGISEIEWLPLHIKLQIFRLGRLQFQPMSFSCDSADIKRTNAVSIPVANGTDVLNVHIPRGTRLLPEDCEKAYLAAAEFFQKEHPVFVCCSWFLHSSLKILLPQESNLLEFQRRYHIFGECSDIPASRHTEEIIFGITANQPDVYPQHTSLQKNAVNYLKAGNHLGYGCGYFIL